MDAYYPMAKAVTNLTGAAELSKNSIAERGREGLQHLADVDLDALDIIATGNQVKIWKLCTVADEGGVFDEVVFRIQGVLTKNELVPKAINRCAPHKAIHLSQHVEICGLGTEIFEQGVSGVIAVHQKLAEHMADAEMFPLAMKKQEPNGSHIPASKRLFTERCDAPTEQDNVFAPGIDTLGRLAKLKGTNLIHAPDNMVKYFRLVVAKDGQSARYVKTIPGAFKIGDLVELQLSFVAMLSNKRVKVDKH
ncbi:hypothetical protein C8R43DRAFT_1136720 [Mycena crocata]|nr:hypothetical protein C8R43DRAFT_1136720 [Mycena crocata]